MKFNPAFLSEDELVAGFAAREHELDLLLEVVRDNNGASNQHILVIGPRGYGKTTLVLRVAAAVRSNPALHSRWHPIVFSEEVEVAEPGELWAEAVFFLGKQTGESRWRDAYARLRRETDPERLRVLALAELRAFSEREGKRLLVAVENLQTLFEQLSDDDAWTVRHTLQSEPWLMLLTTATTRFDAIERPDRALYELFRVVELEPLGPGECAHLFGRLGAGPIDPLRGRALQILTGGNPRLLVVLARFAQGSPLHSLVDDVARLIDDHSDYFKHNIDALPPLERRIFTALAELWAPALAREVAEFARVDVNKTSAVLARLEQHGLVSSHATSPRRKRYQVSERLYNLYWLMRRHGRASDRVRFAIDFIAAYYDAEVLAGACLDFAERALELQPPSRPLYIHGVVQLLDRLDANDRTRVLSRLSAQFLALPEVPEDTRDRLESERARVHDARSAFSDTVAEFFRERPILRELGTLLLSDDAVRGSLTALLEALGRPFPPDLWGRLQASFAAHWQLNAAKLRDLVSRAKHSTRLSLTELIVASAVALSLDGSRDLLRFARILISRYPKSPAPRLILLCLRSNAGDLTEGEFLKHARRLCELYPRHTSVPLALGVLLALSSHKHLARGFLARVVSPAVVLRVADALVDIRDDVLECEQEIVLEPKWRGLSVLTEDSTWEDALAWMARFVRETLADPLAATELVGRAAESLPGSCRLRLLVALDAFQRHAVNDGITALAQAADLRCGDWKTLLTLGINLALCGETARARELLLRSWHLFAPDAPDGPLAKKLHAWFRGAATHVPEAPTLQVAAGLVLTPPKAFILQILALSAMSNTAPMPQICLLAGAVCVARGAVEELHDAFTKSPFAPQLEPFLLALARLSGDETPAPPELEAVAADLLKQLRLVADLATAIRSSTPAAGLV